MDDFVRLCLDMKIHDNQLKQPSGRTQSGSCVYVGRWDGMGSERPSQPSSTTDSCMIIGFQGILGVGDWVGEISWLSFLSLVQ